MPTASSTARHTARRLAPPMAALLAGVLLAGCAGAATTADGPTPAAATPAASRTPETTSPSVGPTEEVDRGDGDVASPSFPATGVLGVADVEGGCTFVEIDGDRYQLMAAPEADVVVDPANGVVATADGEVIAEPGDTITVDGSIDTGVVTFCQIGPVLAATSIEAG